MHTELFVVMTEGPLHPCLLQVWQLPHTILKGSARGYSKSLRYIQPIHLCHHPLQIQVRAVYLFELYTPPHSMISSFHFTWCG